jgi:hypothetical protein
MQMPVLSPRFEVALCQGNSPPHQRHVAARDRDLIISTQRSWKWAPPLFKLAIINKNSNATGKKLQPKFPPLRDKRKGLLGFLPSQSLPSTLFGDDFFVSTSLHKQTC